MDSLHTVFPYHEQLSLAKIENGRDYKIVIQQWWNENDSVTQSSASVFRARSNPTLAIGTIPEPLKSRSFTFTASYTQEQGDALNWCRWKISSSDGKEEIILEDTGRIYGTAELTFPYDGFLNGRTYLIECLVQTENGVETSSFAYVSVQYTVNPIQANLTVCQSTRGNGITVKLPEIKYVPGIANTGVKISDSYLTIMLCLESKESHILAYALKYATASIFHPPTSRPYRICCLRSPARLP